MMVALPTKTPVSLLQELCVRKGITPKYDLVQIEGAVHEPTFKYRVTVTEYSEFGSGQSKKKAKHAAAKAILDKLLGTKALGGTATAGQTGDVQENGELTPLEQQSISEITAQIVSPYDDGIQGNPVGSLQEMCMARRWPPPLYDLVNEEGLPHERQFGIQCSVGKFGEIGTGKSKKLAKRQAAHKMLNKLKDIPQETNSVPLVDDDDELGQKIAARYAGLKDTKISTMTAAHNQKVSQFHRTLKNCSGKNLTELQTTNLNDTSLDYNQLLQEIAAEQTFEVTFIDIDETTVKGQRQCLVQLSTLPVAVCYGAGKTNKDAATSAAHAALEYLKILTKK